MLKEWVKRSGPYRWLKTSRFYDYITLNRDAWVRQAAAKIPTGVRVLDVGAGSCPYRAHFSHCVYQTQDFTGLTDEQLRDGKYGQIDYVSEITAIPVAAGSFDVVLCTEVIEHVPNPIGAVKEMGRVLKPGGTLLLSAPLGSGIHQAPYHFYGGYTPFWYRRFLGEAGFDEVVVEANGGFFKMFGWECVRFLHTLSVATGNMPWLLRPFALVLMLLMACGSVPVILLCDVLDRYDRDRGFTAGYHVTARKRAD
jgi:SAM-dependent methyltransferase